MVIFVFLCVISDLADFALHIKGRIGPNKDYQKKKKKGRTVISNLIISIFLLLLQASSFSTILLQWASIRPFNFVASPITVLSAAAFWLCNNVDHAFAIAQAKPQNVEQVLTFLYCWSGWYQIYHSQAVSKPKTHRIWSSRHCLVSQKLLRLFP